MDLKGWLLQPISDHSQKAIPGQLKTMKSKISKQNVRIHSYEAMLKGFLNQVIENINHKQKEL